MKVNIRKDKLLVLPQEAPTVSKGGIYIPDDARRRPQWGRVVGVGPNITDIKVGDTVFYPQYIGLEVKLPDDKGLETVFLVMEDKNIIGTVEDGVEPGTLETDSSGESLFRPNDGLG